MSVKMPDESLITDATTLLNEKGKMNESGDVLTLNSSDYTKFLTEKGIPVPVQEKFITIETAKRVADLRKSAEMLENLIDESKKNGGDPNTITATVKTMLPHGKDEIILSGKRVFPNPQSPGGVTNCYGHAKAIYKRNGTMPKNELDEIANRIEKKICGK